MSTTLSLTGNSIVYTFSGHWEIVDWTKPTHIPAQEVVGADQVFIDTNALTQAPIRITVEGTLVGTSYDNLLTRYMSLRTAVESRPDPMTLSDGAGFSIDVYKESMRVQRVRGSGGKKFQIQLVFVAPTGADVTTFAAEMLVWSTTLTTSWQDVSETDADSKSILYKVRAGETAEIRMAEEDSPSSYATWTHLGILEIQEPEQLEALPEIWMRTASGTATLERVTLK